MSILVDWGIVKLADAAFEAIQKRLSATTAPEALSYIVEKTLPPGNAGLIVRDMMSEGRVFGRIAEGDLHPETIATNALKALQNSPRWPEYSAFENPFRQVVCTSLRILLQDDEYRAQIQSAGTHELLTRTAELLQLQDRHTWLLEQQGANIESIRDAMVGPDFDIDSLPGGFRRIDDIQTGGLRSYLRRDIQPYYGWEAFAQECLPPNCSSEEFTSESALLERTLNDPKPLVLIGEGGSGKSRLGIELCLNAAQDGWLGLSGAGYITPNYIRDLIQCLRSSSQKVILFIDYVEELDDADSFDEIHDLVMRHPEKFRLIATCRKNFFENKRLAPRRLRDGRSHVLDLTPSHASDYTDFLKGWRARVCQIIMGGKGVTTVTIPALATILAFSVKRGQSENFTQIDEEGRWIAERLTKSLRDQDPDLILDDATIANVLCCFPMEDEVKASLSQTPDIRSFIEALNRDGWVQRESGKRSLWRLGHDLLCDLPFYQILTSNRNTIPEQLETALTFANKYDSKKKLVTALGRIAERLSTFLGKPESLDLYHRLIPSFSAAPPHNAFTLLMLQLGAHSLSLTPLEKLRVLFAAPDLSFGQVTELKLVFFEESKKFREIYSEFPNDVICAYFWNFGPYKYRIQQSVEQWLDPENGTNAAARLREIFDDEDLTRCFELYFEAMRLGQLNRSEEAIAVYDDLLARFGTADTPALQEQCARALNNKGYRLDQLNRSEEAIAVYDDLLARFGTADTPALQEQCARALNNKGVTLGQLNRSEEAIAVYDDLLARFGTADTPALQEQCARALNNKGYRLGQLNRSEEAIAVYDDLLARFGTADTPALQEQCMSALANSVEMKLLLGQVHGAIERADNVLARAGATDQESAIMPFLIWVADKSARTPAEVLHGIDALDAGVNFTWGFDEIMPLIDEFPTNRKQTGKAFVAYFTGQIDRAELKRFCL